MLSEAEIKDMYDYEIANVAEYEEDMIQAKHKGDEKLILQETMKYELAKERLRVLRYVLYGN